MDIRIEKSNLFDWDADGDFNYLSFAGEAFFISALSFIADGGVTWVLDSTVVEGFIEAGDYKYCGGLDDLEDLAKDDSISVEDLVRRFYDALIDYYIEALNDCRGVDNEMMEDIMCDTDVLESYQRFLD